jgi:hypothetical protein
MAVNGDKVPDHVPPIDNSKTLISKHKTSKAAKNKKKAEKKELAQLEQSQRYRIFSLLKLPRSYPRSKRL